MTESSKCSGEMHRGSAGFLLARGVKTGVGFLREFPLRVFGPPLSMSEETEEEYREFKCWLEGKDVLGEPEGPPTSPFAAFDLS